MKLLYCFQKYIFVPGDNDVGGEKEPVSETKLSWFNQSFGDYNDMISIEKSNWDVQFMKYNKFFPKHLINPLKGVGDSGLKNKDTFRLLISHFSVLRFISEPVQEVKCFPVQSFMINRQVKII